MALLLSVASVPVLAQSQTVTFFAHRASRFEFDENTLPAFKACYEKGMRGFETDIRMTKDGQLGDIRKAHRLRRQGRVYDIC